LEDEGTRVKKRLLKKWPSKNSGKLTEVQEISFTDEIRGSQKQRLGKRGIGEDAGTKIKNT